MQDNRNPNQNLNTEKTFSRLNDVYQNTQDQIKFADAKAGGLIALTSLNFGFILSNYEKLLAFTGTLWFTPLMITFLLSLAIGLGLCFSILFSRFGGSTPQTMVFFAHINEKYKLDWERYYKDVSTSDDETWTKQFSGQILEVSKIATTKHRLFRHAVKLLLLSLLISFVLAALLVLSEGVQKEQKAVKIKNDQEQAILRAP